MRVPLADVCPVRKAEIGELGVAERRSDPVHVARDARSVDEGQDLAAHFPASGREVLVRLNRRGLLDRVVEH